MRIFVVVFLLISQAIVADVGVRNNGVGSPAAAVQTASRAAAPRPTGAVEISIGEHRVLTSPGRVVSTLRSAWRDLAAGTMVDTSVPDVSTVSGDEVRSGELSTAPFSLFGVSWQRSADLTDVMVRYRVRSGGSWSTWSETGAGEGPQSGVRVNTDAVVVQPSDGLEVTVTSAAGAVDDVKAVLIDPAISASTAGATTVQAAMVSRPNFISRAGWGADESLRNCTPDVTTSVVSAAVHHTDSINTYSADEAAGIVRGIYIYHTRSSAAGGRGWCDIGYNALVDRFGRIYEGRAGSFDQSIVGVHTGGFNSRTFGVSVIGNFETTDPPAAVMEGLSQAIAWKFATERILAGAFVTMVSGGGESKYPEGTVVTFPTIYGHRDAGQTACPGALLYARLDEIRARVAALANDAVNASPVAIWDTTSGRNGAVAISGWGFDPDSRQSLVVDEVVDGVSHPFLADGSRPDVAAAYPGVGAAHGFSASVPVAPGRHVVCPWVRNVGSGNDQLLGCRAVEVSGVTSVAPIGFVDEIVGTPSSVRVSGWTLDPDSTEPLTVQISIAGQVSTVTADVLRPDVAAAFPGQGAAHGFAVEIPAGAGSHQVCVTAINVPAGANTVLRCQVANVVNAPPFGFVDSAVSTASSILVSGWSIDPEAAGPVQMHLYLDGAFAGSVLADGSRPDVGRAYPGAGSSHGFSTELPAAEGVHRVCVYPINQPTGYNPTIDCRTVTVSNAGPVGSVDQVVAVGSAIRVAGWTFDPDTSAALQVHVYVDDKFAGSGTADVERADVAAAFPGRGAGHGYSFDVASVSGTHQVCIYAINQPVSTNPRLGCVEITVA